MAAGLGFKTFTTGEVLTAADTNGYLMQGINVFASTAARDAAITSPQEGQFAFTKDTNGLWYYDGAAWVASGATGDIEGVSAGIGISGGGTSGTVTVTNSMATAIDAKGDLIAGTGADAFSRLGVGANNTVLTADSAEATGLKWAAAGSSSPLTTKGDLYTFSTTNARLPIGADFAFLEADAAEATGNKWNISAFTTYTPTITAGSGSATTVSVTGRYKRIGKVCIVENDIYVTNKGTAAGDMIVTLPFTSAAKAYVGNGMENSVIGVSCRVYVAPSDNKIGIVQYNGSSTLWSNGYGIYTTITYEVA
jgi:hypothetical protein